MKNLRKIKKTINRYNPFSAVNTLRNHIVQIEGNLSLIQQKIDYNKQEIINNTAIQLLQMRSLLGQSNEPVNHQSYLNKSNYKEAHPKPYNYYLNHLKQINPEVFNYWKKCFDIGEESYINEKEHSCSTWSNIYVRAFKDFINIHAKGRLLDQGCGMYGLPYYLRDYPIELISAIEPLEQFVASDFEIVRCFSELLPWPDASFQTIVNATSLDHVLCLDTALSETYRVLQPGGNFLVWIASIDGAKPFDPDQRPIKPIDKFHLFHFHESWFEEKMSDKYRIAEKLIFPTPSFDHIFYNFKKHNV